jgi:hypothetical protein
MVISSHGGSPFQGFVTPILFRIRGNRRFNLPLQVRYRPEYGPARLGAVSLRTLGVDCSLGMDLGG